MALAVTDEKNDDRAQRRDAGWERTLQYALVRRARKIPPRGAEL